MKAIWISFVLLIFFFANGFGQDSVAKIDTVTTNGWKATNFSDVDTFYTGFSSTHYDGGTSQIFGFKFSSSNGYVRIEKTLSNPISVPFMFAFEVELLGATPRSFSTVVGSSVYLADGDTVCKIGDWGVNSNYGVFWNDIGISSIKEKIPLKEFKKIILEFKCFTFDTISAEFLLDHMVVSLDSTSRIPVVIDSFEGTVTSIDNIPRETPQSFILSQNYPNPFNPITSIKYTIPSASRVSLKVYDILGREVKTLVDEEKSAGDHTVTFDGSNLPSGTYFYRLQANSGFVRTKKMVLVK